VRILVTVLRELVLFLTLGGAGDDAMAGSSGCSVGQIWSAGVSRTVSPSARQCLGAVLLLKMGFPESFSLLSCEELLHIFSPPDTPKSE
jgi:hypothetical protein